MKDPSLRIAGSEGRGWAWPIVVIFLSCALASGVKAQETIVILDENDEVGADYRDASAGFVAAPDTLRLEADGKLPLHVDHAFSGTVSGLLEYRHDVGSWEMAIGTDGWPSVDLSGFDTLVVHLNGPAALDGPELPRVGLEDASGTRTSPVWLSSPQDVRIDADETGFTEESTTNAIVLARYSEALPADRRRPGYPENLSITFAAEPMDTSVAGIGAPSVPARFRIERENGMRVDFRFRDVDADGTLSASDEYVEVLLPEDEESARLLPAWRLTLAPTQSPEPLEPPGEGDVYRLVLDFEEFTLDDDPETWQRLALPMADVTEGSAYDAASFKSVVFAHGGQNPAVRTLWVDRITAEKNDDESFLEMIQRETFKYFWEEANPSNGLVRDRSTTTSPASIAAVGFGLSALTVGIDRGWITREEGIERVAATLRFFWNAPQSTAPDATGHNGFFYHFLDMQTGRRAWDSELSTIDTALLLGGVLHVREYFDGGDEAEVEIRELADAIYERVDWTWVQFRHPTNPTAAINHGWRPESGFLAHDWIGYNEAMILYVLALGSPTHPVEPEAWDVWVDGYGAQWRTEEGYTFLTFPPLFGHQYSHVWIDFRGIQDAYMREKGIDYFENSRRATLAQRAYHVRNPGGYPNYGKDEWGLTASDTPTGYRARGAPPPQNDDGTLVPTAPGGSIAFTPDESIAALRTMHRKYAALWGPYGFRDAYNVERFWFDQDYIGIDQGPILLMIENFRTEAIWDVSMRHEAIGRGLARAGFLGTGLSTGDETPGDVTELEVYPNPSTRTAQVSYVLDAAGSIELVLYDLLARRIAVLERGRKPAGSHRLETDFSGLSSGTYFLVLHAKDRKITLPLSVVR